jgi:outer membrane murein-binding lipoprotein Lpp
MGPIGIRSSQADTRLDKSGRFWRRGGHRLARVPKLRSKLVRLEQEIGGFADRMTGNATRRRPAVKKRSRIAAFFRSLGRDLVYMFRRVGATVASARKVLTIGVRAAPEPQQPKPVAAPARRPVPAKRARAAGTSGIGLVLVSVCFGLLVLSGVVIALLFLQLRGMKDEIARWQQALSATQTQLRQVEKAARQKADSETKAAAAATTRAERGPLVLGSDEMKAIRASIKVLPSKPGAQAKARVGEELPDLRSAPVPEALTDQIPKLRGARFAVDDNGAIILFAEGSSRVGAVIERQ